MLFNDLLKKITRNSSENPKCTTKQLVQHTTDTIIIYNSFGKQEMTVLRTVATSTSKNVFNLYNIIIICF